ncbi:MAG: hypothetical protein ACOYXY_21115 [Thermodesulfobacteriota bacterium]
MDQLKHMYETHFKPYSFPLILAAALIILCVGVALNIRHSNQLHRQLLTGELRALAGQLDAAIAMRSLATGLLTDNLNLNDLTQSDGLVKALAGLEQSCPDLVGMEILDENGEILALLGEVGISKGRLDARAQNDVIQSLQAAPQGVTWLFKDEAATDSFSVIRKRTTPDDKTWFLRARFARRPLNHILRNASLRAHGKADLIDRETRSDWAMAASAGTTTGEGQDSGNDQPVRLASSSWCGLMTGEASLKTPGWLVSLEKPAAGGFTGLFPFFLMGVALVGSLFAVRAARDTYTLAVAGGAGSSREPTRSGPERSGAPAAAYAGASRAPSGHDLTSDGFETPDATLWAEGWTLEDEVLAPDPGSEATKTSHEVATAPSEKPSDTDVPEYLEISWAEPTPSDSQTDRKSTRVSEKSTRPTHGCAGA